MRVSVSMCVSLRDVCVFMCIKFTRRLHWLILRRSLLHTPPPFSSLLSNLCASDSAHLFGNRNLFSRSLLQYSYVCVCLSLSITVLFCTGLFFLLFDITLLHYNLFDLA